MAFERLHPGRPEWDAYYANHIHRYQFAAERLRRVGKVLDAACGVGYGARFLAENGIGRVIAVDRNDDALRIGHESFAHESVQFVKDDCQTLVEVEQFGPFDAIVSFETLEHLPDPKSFLIRCRTLLAPDGQLILSTPNISVTGGPQKRKWDYHEQEYTAVELLELLTECGFSKATLYGQTNTPIGRLRTAVRAEILQLRSNPFFRLGNWIQRIIRGRPKPRPPLPEDLEDFEIHPFPVARDCDDMGSDGPFVLLVVAQ